MKHLRNTIMVLAATALVSFTVYSGVSALAPADAKGSRAHAEASSSTDAAVGDTAYTCPRTGCDATSCHACRACWRSGAR